MEEDLTGKRFGKLTVLQKLNRKKNGSWLWLCKCDCGKFVKVRTDSLTSGRTVSCKCRLKEEESVKRLNDGKKLEDHTSPVYFQGTIRKNSITGINGVTRLRNGKYRAYIGYKRKTYVLYEGKSVKKAADARAEAEEMMKKGEFEEWIERL